MFFSRRLFLRPACLLASRRRLQLHLSRLGGVWLYPAAGGQKTVPWRKDGNAPHVMRRRYCAAKCKRLPCCRQQPQARRPLHKFRTAAVITVQGSMLRQTETCPYPLSAATSCRLSSRTSPGCRRPRLSGPSAMRFRRRTVSPASRHMRLICLLSP